MALVFMRLQGCMSIYTLSSPAPLYIQACSAADDVHARNLFRRQRTDAGPIPCWWCICQRNWGQRRHLLCDRTRDPGVSLSRFI
ncbi:uncharacterized protein K460DRAFT_53728 [Cucurbitaria berberidis CBS 394.84]|uniref:Uncharacterized protein n=1 Tax=Cucurbitaria berberidis CBS 394.84 TaxID=1168544 RepID=A0A9P4GKQ2_9PLEO|nr:uncharacterized protein K460DRAFT_53728 [Cucurbitaria berberidis CBS 394.84]KAF1847126.1 hypothetical protein K460DRAFT_53728 [Cucurbitaria berberidis CBS 394.84]